MRSRIATILVSTFAAVVAAGALSTASATAAEQSPSPSSPAPSCSYVFFSVTFGQGIDAFCPQAPGTYAVVAQCSDGVNSSFAPGTLAIANFAPSVAICRGGLLSSAQIVSYYVVQ
jgi:hypothetical protein